MTYEEFAALPEVKKMYEIKAKGNLPTTRQGALALAKECSAMLRNAGVPKEKIAEYVNRLPR
jgi:hypothetical protein